MGHHVTGSPWNKHSGTSAHYKSSKWKKLKSHEQFWKWFMIGGALRSAFIVMGTSPFTSLRWQTHSASLRIPWATLRLRVVWRRAPQEHAGWGGACGHVSSTPPVVRVSFAQPEGERIANPFWHWKYAKRHQLRGEGIFSLLQLYHNCAPKCTYKHFITRIWNNAWKINLRIVPKQKVFLSK